MTPIMNSWDNIKKTFRQGSTLIKLIYLNAGVFVLLKVLIILFKLFNISAGFIVTYLVVPADLNQLLHHLWTPVTYMFLHEGFFHVFFNMLCLYWFGKIFLLHFSEKQLVGLYIIGGLMGAAFYIAGYNIFPYFADFLPNSILLGASGSVMAIILASALQAPNMQIQLLLLGGIKLKYIAIAAVIASFFGLDSDNSGGELAHLGGAAAGYLFASLNRRNTDITNWINSIIDFFVNLFKPGKTKLKKSRPNKKTRMSDGEYNVAKAKNMADVDRILDKIKQSGYDSLTADEKRRLFEQGNRT